MGKFDEIKPGTCAGKIYFLKILITVMTKHDEASVSSQLLYTDFMKTETVSCFLDLIRDGES